MESTPLIELEAVGYCQQGVEILRDISWQLERSQHWAVLGPNGCGKTTLLRIACGYLWPTSGLVRRLGDELVDLSVLRRSIGWVANDLATNIPSGELAAETVLSGKYAQVGLKRLGAAHRTVEDLTAAKELLCRMQCESLIDKPFRVLSQGERQQVLVARARMVEPLLIILDEPCAGMDPGVRERFLAWLDAIAAAKDSCALVLVTHHVEEIMPHFERSLVMQHGGILASGLTNQVVTPELIEATYQVRVEKLEFFQHRLWPVWGGLA
jgi:iron complex transport system ATP-binding protein